MKRSILAVLAVVALGGVSAHAALPTEILGPGLNSGRTEYHQTWDRVLSPDTLYSLTGLYYVDSTYTITIPAGTVVEGDTAATLVIARGGKIYAMGEPCNPVVLTSRKAPGSRAPGDWGGLVLLGAAPVNKVNPVIEGGLVSGTFGGTDPNDNSGVVKYTRVEFAGYRFQLNNEINGMTLGGIGAGTEIHHVQVSYAFDDSYECFGGTVDMRYLVAYGGTDDEFDSDFGFIGKMQFLFGLRDPFYWDASGESNGFESDNDGSGSNDQPFTHPVISNATLIGPERTDAYVPAPPVSSFQHSAVIRRNTRLSLFNSVIMGYPWGVSLRDSGTKTAAAGNVLDWADVSIQATVVHGTTAGSCTPPNVQHVHEESRWPCTDAIAPGVYNWFQGESGTIGSSTRMPNTIKLVDMSQLTDPDPRPDTGSELIGSAHWTHPYLASGFDTTPTYRGAFDPSLPMYAQWTRCWTEFDPQNVDYSNGIVVTGAKERTPAQTEVILENYPNPFNPITMIRFSVPVAGHVTLKVYNVRGELVSTLIDRDMDAGVFEQVFNAEHLATGTYFYRITGNGFTKTDKMVLLK
jgi:hypothetical protein